MTKRGIVDFCVKITEPGYEASAADYIRLMYEKRSFDGKYRSFRYMPTAQGLSVMLTQNPNFEYTNRFDDYNAKIIRRI